MKRLLLVFMLFCGYISSDAQIAKWLIPPLYDITPPSLLYKAARPSAAAARRSHRHARPSGGHYLQENLRRMKIYFQSLKKKIQGMKKFFQGMEKIFKRFRFS